MPRRSGGEVDLDGADDLDTARALDTARGRGGGRSIASSERFDNRGDSLGAESAGHPQRHRKLELYGFQRAARVERGQAPQRADRACSVTAGERLKKIVGAGARIAQAEGGLDTALAERLDEIEQWPVNKAVAGGDVRAACR